MIQIFKRFIILYIACIGYINAECPKDVENGSILWIEQSPHQFQKPNSHCTTDLCRNLLALIDNARLSIDFAVLGFYGQPDILTALRNAQRRGVQVRGVVDKNLKGKSLYADTDKWRKYLENVRDDYSVDKITNRKIKRLKHQPNYIFTGDLMHNKFFIVDRRYVWTGSANISDTGIGGYNANNAVLIDSPLISAIYRAEFEQMHEKGRYHREKKSIKKKSICVIVDNQQVDVYFSPKSYTTKRGLLPLIKQAKNSIDIAMFVFTDKKIARELVKAYQRGVNIQIILDATGASNKYSQHRYLRNNNIAVKVESWGGKMHMKSALVDNKYLVIGSMNWSRAGTSKNDENTLIIHADKALADNFNRFFSNMWNSIPKHWLYADPLAESKDSGTSCVDGIDNDFNRVRDQADPSC